MNRRALLMGTGVALLVVLNVWNWWPQAPKKTREATVPASGFRPDDFRLKIEAIPEAGTGSATRDLFQPKRPPPPPAGKVNVPPAPPPKTPEQLAEEAARAELAQFRLVGVVLRGGRAQGFLMKGEQSFMVNAGDRAGDRFTVETVTAEGVVLKDPRTGVSGQIGVSGK